VKSGFANVLYWGYAQIGYRDYRVCRFRSRVTVEKLKAFRDLVKNGATPSLLETGGLNLPEFGGVSFISKILMFLSPVDHCVLDLQLARMRVEKGPRALDGLRVRVGQQIRVTRNNQAAYDRWRAECRTISEMYLGGSFRTVDIERGFFNLVQTSWLEMAKTIYRSF
jgi:hypothetical protein